MRIYTGLLVAGSLLAGAWLADLRPPAIARPPGGPVLTGDLPAAAAPAVRPLTTAEAMDGFPAWSPDGRLVAFMRDGQVWLIGHDGGGARSLTAARGWDVAPVFAPDGKQVAFIRTAPDGEAGSELRLVSLEGREQVLVAEPDLIGYAAFAPDGRRLAYTTRSQIKLYDFKTRKAAVLADLGPGADLLPGGLAWSPDGQRLVFGAGQEQTAPDRLEMELYLISAAGGQPEPLTRDGGIMPDFSPDGARVVFRRPRTRSGIYELELATGQVRLRLRDQANHMYFHPRWAPDGRSILLSRLELPQRGADRHLISRIVVLDER